MDTFNGQHVRFSSYVQPPSQNAIAMSNQQFPHSGLRPGNVTSSFAYPPLQGTGGNQPSNLAWTPTPPALATPPSSMCKLFGVPAPVLTQANPMVIPPRPGYPPSHPTTYHHHQHQHLHTLSPYGLPSGAPAPLSPSPTDLACSAPLETRDVNFKGTLAALPHVSLQGYVPGVALSPDGPLPIGEKEGVLYDRPTIGETDRANSPTKEELEDFTKKFKLKRIRLGYTQQDVGRELGEYYGNLFSQTTICRFEAQQLSHRNMCKIYAIMKHWSDDMENNVRQHPVAENKVQVKRRKKRTSIESAAKTKLEQFFSVQPKPSPTEVAEYAAAVGLEKEVVRVWFCNHRQKTKRLTGPNQLHSHATLSQQYTIGSLQLGI